MPGKKPSGRFTALGGRIEDIIGGRLGPQFRNFYRLHQVWPEIVGAKAARHSQPAWLGDEILAVYVDGPGWMQELSFMKEAIVRRAAQIMQPMTVRDIRWIQGDAGWHPEEMIRKRPDYVIDRSREKEFVSMLQTVADARCREALHHFWLHYRKRLG